MDPKLLKKLGLQLDCEAALLNDEETDENDDIFINSNKQIDDTMKNPFYEEQIDAKKQRFGCTNDDTNKIDAEQSLFDENCIKDDAKKRFDDKNTSIVDAKRRYTTFDDKKGSFHSDANKNDAKAKRKYTFDDAKLKNPFYDEQIDDEKQIFSTDDEEEIIIDTKLRSLIDEAKQIYLNNDAKQIRYLKDTNIDDAKTNVFFFNNEDTAIRFDDENLFDANTNTKIDAEQNDTIFDETLFDAEQNDTKLFDDETLFDTKFDAETKIDEHTKLFGTKFDETLFDAQHKNDAKLFHNDDDYFHQNQTRRYSINGNQRYFENRNSFSDENEQRKYCSENNIVRNGNVNGGKRIRFSSENLRENSEEDGLKNVQSQNEKPKLEKKKRCCGNITLLILGICNLALAILTIRFPIFKQLMRERLRMTPGLPPFELWYRPPTTAKFNVFIFNITNSDRVMSGNEQKLNVQEVGPVIFRENLVHKDVVFHTENSTMSFTATRSPEFLPEENEPDILDREIIVPNLMSLGIASYMHDASYFTKFGLRLLLASEKPFVKVTVRQYLFNMTSPVMKMGRNFMPYLVPLDNVGIINIIYNSFTDRANVNYGPRKGDSQFFLINSYHGQTKVPGHESAVCRTASVVNSTEGVVYPQDLKRDTVLRYWRKTHCKVLPLYFEEESRVGLVNTYKYILLNDSYDRLRNETQDCHRGKPRLPSGLIDVSKCVFGFPIAASFPHYFAGDQNETQTLRDQVTGLKPNDKRHRSFIKAEPITGIPISQCARSQSNLIVHKLSGFTKDIDKMSDRVIPMFWAEYCLPPLPTFLTVLVIFVSQIMPVLEYLLPIIFVFTTVWVTSIVIGRKAMTSQIWTNERARNKSPRINYSNFIRVNTGLYFDRKHMMVRRDRK